MNSMMSRVFVRHKSKACYKKHVRASTGALKVNPRKVVLGNDVQNVLSKSNFVAVIHYNDLKSQDWNDIRLKLDKHDISLKVIPTKITRKALKDTKFANVASLLKGPTSLAFSDKPCINDLLKVIKNESKLYLLGGMIEEELMTTTSIEKHAKLPDKSLMHAQLLGTLVAQQMTLTRLLLDGGARGLSVNLDHLSKKDE